MKFGSVGHQLIETATKTAYEVIAGADACNINPAFELIKERLML